MEKIWRIKDNVIFVVIPHEGYLIDFNEPGGARHYYLEETSGYLGIAILSAICKAMEIGKNATPPRRTGISSTKIFQAINKFFTDLDEAVIKNWLHDKHNSQFVSPAEGESEKVYFAPTGPPRPVDNGKVNPGDISALTYGRQITFSWPWPTRVCCG